MTETAGVEAFRVARARILSIRPGTAQLAEIADDLLSAEQALLRDGEAFDAARRALEVRSHRYRDLFELMPGGYLLTDEAGVIRDANRAAIALLARGDRSQVIDRMLARFLAPDDRRLLRHHLMSSKRGARRDPVEIEVTLQPSGRSAVPAAITIAPAFHQDALPDGFRLLLRDTSAHRRIEEAAQAANALAAANRAKDEFLAMLSHELRNPLHAILGWSGILLTEDLPRDERWAAIETIDRNGRRLNRLIGDLLDVARIARRKLVFEPKACDLTTVVADAFEGVRTDLRVRKQRFVAKLNDPGVVIADPARIQQIVSNLLANAVKFTPPGGSIELRMDTRDRDVEIVVCDSGVGIEPELVPHVFERFRQGDSAPTEPGGGLGLGLAIARTLARMHGGDVSVSSAGLGSGSTFTFRLPLRRLPAGAAESPDVPPLDAPESPLRRLSGLNVLIVCSDHAAGEAWSRPLIGAGAMATVERWPPEAPERPAEWSADALIVVVPAASRGGRLLAEITAIERRVNGALPVLAITPSSAAARRWLSLPAEVKLCTKGDLEPCLLPSRLAAIAQISGWAPSL